MSLLATHLALTAARTRSAIAEPCRIANTSNFNTLDAGGDRRERSWTELSAAPRQSRACQSGTIEFGPLWNGPALRPAFVAQVLGQVIMNHPSRAAGLAVLCYRHGAAQVSSALLLDVSI